MHLIYLPVLVVCGAEGELLDVHSLGLEALWTLALDDEGAMDLLWGKAGEVEHPVGGGFSELLLTFFAELAVDLDAIAELLLVVLALALGAEKVGFFTT